LRLMNNFCKFIPHAMLAFFVQTAFAASPIENMQTTAKSQLESIGTLGAKIDALRLEFKSEADAVPYGTFEFCSVKPGDSACNGKEDSDEGEAAGTADGERGVPVSYISWGFVIDGTETDNDYNDVQDRAPGTSDFKIIKATSATFGDKLCFEVHFKDTSEYNGISLALSNKTVVLCARSSAATQELIDIDCIDADLSDGCNKSTHATIPSGNAGFQCFNPHGKLVVGTDPPQYIKDVGNGGNALGYMTISDDGTDTRYRMVEGITNIFESCFPAVEIVNNP